MGKNRQLVIFARAPRLGYGKTRLAQDIGPDAAHTFYRNCLRQLLNECSKGPWNLVVAAACAEDSTHPLFQAHRVITQTDGNLGQRMLKELSNNQTHHTLIIGSDIPELKQHHLETAFAALEHSDLVFGPATDGGFWSVGCRQQLILPKEFMQQVRWSTEFALHDTLLSIPKNMKVTQVDMLSDIDDASDYHSKL